MALVNALLRSEAVAALVLGIAVWVTNDGSLVWFAALILVPDLSMIGYAAGTRAGAVTYNLVHNWAVAGVAAGIGWWLDIRWLLLTGALLVAHVGMDRALGYGLKLPSDFRDTHLGRIGRDHA